MNDNKQFWQRYAPFYSVFMEKGGGGKIYDIFADKIKPYLTAQMNLLADVL